MGGKVDIMHNCNSDPLSMLYMRRGRILLTMTGLVLQISGTDTEKADFKWPCWDQILITCF